jgi:hypothetical protein
MLFSRLLCLSPLLLVLLFVVTITTHGFVVPGGPNMMATSTRYHRSSSAANGVRRLSAQPSTQVAADDSTQTNNLLPSTPPAQLSFHTAEDSSRGLSQSSGSLSVSEVVSQLESEGDPAKQLQKLQQSVNQLLKFSKNYDENKFYRRFMYSMIRFMFEKCYDSLCEADSYYSPNHGIETFSQAIRKAKKMKDMSVVARAFRHVSNLPQPEAGVLLADCLTFSEMYVPDALSREDFSDLNKNDILRQFRGSTASVATRENIFLMERLVKWFNDAGHF